MLFEFGISLADKMSGPAKQAQASALALKKTLTALKAEQDKLATSQAQLARAKSLGDVEGYKHFSAAVASGTKSVFDLQNALSGAAKPAAGMTAGLAGLVEKLGPAGAGLSMIAQAEVAVGVAALGAAVAVGGLIFEAAKMGIEFSQLRERTVTAFEALGKAPGAGEATLSMLKGLGERLPQSRDQLVQWTKSLQTAGVTDLGELREHLKATAAAQALVGDEGAQAYEALTRKVHTLADAHQKLKIAPRALASIAKTGANVSDVAQEMGISTESLAKRLKAGTVDAAAFGDALHTALVKKGRGPIAALGLDVDVIGKKFDDFKKEIFEGVDASPFTRQLQVLTQQFSQTTTSGKAMKTGVTAGLNDVFVWAGKATREVTLFGLRTGNASLQAYIAMKPLLRHLDMILVVTGAIAKASGGLAARGLAEALIPGGGAVLATASLGGKERAEGSGLSTGRGFAIGLAKARGSVVAAASGLAAAASSAISRTLDMHSPSRVTGAQGENTATSYAGGIRRGTPAVGAASAGMAQAPIQAIRGAPKGGDSGGGTSRVVHVGGIHITAAPGQSTNDATEAGIAMMFERLALQRGA